LKFPITNPVRLTELKTIKTKPKEGKDSVELTFATIVNTLSFEFLTTKLVLADGQTMADVVEQRDYNAVVTYDGEWGSVTLTPAAGFPTTASAPAKTAVKA